ncbi:response regulator transcription factor [Nocardia otitidiscaviarum]|uniref:Response regulator transcription factor n=1 Tax=Nocardia otitidiscaviarum TaxID=1823 RepID=A0A516NY05_9NOCA|nr:response regulator transcription factor [Nocardia otitidiscaviarum]
MSPRQHGCRASVPRAVTRRRGEQPERTDVPPELSVFVVDDHELVRRGVATLLGDQPGMRAAGEAASVLQAMARIPVQRPDVVVIDVHLPDGCGIDLCRALLSRMNGLRCVVFTASADEAALSAAIEAGASAFIVKDISGERLVQAIREVAAGGSMFDDRVTAALDRRRHHDADLGELGERDRQLLAMLAEGLTNKEIAARMFIAEKTVRNQLTGLFARLGVQTRTQAAVLAAGARVSYRDDLG